MHMKTVIRNARVLTMDAEDTILDRANVLIDGDMIVMEMTLFQGEQPLMTTELKLRNHGVLMVGGPRYEEGMLILSISADCRCPRPPTTNAGAAPVEAPSAASQAAAPE